jgi:diguanylate cyclase (GGDEF)-like protein
VAEPGEHDELRRQAALYSLALLDTEPEEEFDRIARLAQRLLAVPGALVSFMDHDRQWYQSRVGVDEAQAVRSESFCTHVIDDGTPLVVDDASLDARFADNPQVQAEDGIRFYAGVPIHSPGGHAVGTLCVFDSHARTTDDQLLEPLLDLAAMVDEIIAARVRANVDALTGVQNRRGFLEAAAPLLRLADRAGAVMTLGYFDVNGLKGINDRLGHEAGDRAIAETGRLLGSCFRTADVVARVGGDEFVALFVVTGSEGAAIAAGRFVEAMEQRNATADLPFPLSVAAGFIERQPGGETIDELLARADQAMYERKRAGRS